MSLSPSTDVTEWFDTLAKVLLRCFVIGVLLLLFWFGAFVLASDMIYASHGKWFDLTRHELHVIHYCGMAFFKGCLLLFFLFPYLAIRWTLGKRTGEAS